MNEKDLDVRMYREYGIAEWHEKCLVLSDIESIVIKKDLEEGKNSSLVALAKLPFPTFARVYLSRFPNSNIYLRDPAFTYKLFLMRESNIKLLCESIRNPESTRESLEIKFGIQERQAEVKELMSTPLDVIPKLAVSNQRAKNCILKFLYLTQYIDFEEARKLNLSIVPFLEAERQEGCYADGYELERKLSTLNPVVRLIFVKLIGLYGQKRMSIKDITRELKVPVGKIQAIYDKLFPAFFKTYSDFKWKTGYIDREYSIGEFREYANKTYRNLDLYTQIWFTYQNSLTESERLVLSSCNNKEMAAFIAYKYIYHDREKVEQYLMLGKKEIDGFGSLGGLL